MKKSLLILLIFLATIFATEAKVMSVSAAKLVAENFINQQFNNSTNKNRIALELNYTKKGLKNSLLTCFYVFNVTNGDGFVIVSAENNVDPILGYSTEKDFEKDKIPSNIEKWLNEYSVQIELVINKQLSSTTSISKWEGLLNNHLAIQKSNPTAVRPLLKTIWDQGDYYNDQCPNDNNVNERTVTGCVATAMAQAMKYWNFPTTGTGTHTYYHSTYGSLSANFGTTTYNWSNMPNAVNFANSDVAKLMYHCGVAIEMNYGLASNGGSGAMIGGMAGPSAEKALQENFKYSGSLQEIRKDYYTEDQWITLIKNEAIAGRVVIYGGYSSDLSSGHCFVADGFDVNDYIHFNWGWSGANNGYFSVASLIPDPIGTGIGSGSGDYTTMQIALIGLKPPTNSQPSVDFIASSTLTNVGSTITLSDLSANIPDEYNWSITPSTFTFVNGSSNFSKFPEVIFNAAGQYTVTLGATNTFGTGTLTKTTYITVNPALLSQVCDTLTNFGITDQKKNYRVSGGGYYAGHNKTSALKGYAEYYPNYSPYTHLSGVVLEFAHAQTNSNTNTVSVNVYSVSNGKPGTILTSKTVRIIDIVSDVNNNLPTTVLFNSPYQLTGAFFVGISLTYVAGDTVSLYTGEIGQVTSNTSFFQNSVNAWCAWPICWTNNQHLAISPMVSKLPTADFTYNCPGVGVPVNFDASTSTNSYNYSWTFVNASITNSNYYTVANTYSNAGTYAATLVVTGACGTTNSITKQVTIANSSPVNVVANASVLSLCQGQQLTLSGSGATTYTWNNGATNGTPFTPSSSGTTVYTVIGTTNGCSGTADVSVTVNPSPVVTISPVTANICAGQSITLTGAGGAQTYLWNNGITNGVSFIPSLGTVTYTVTGTGANNCTNTANIAVTSTTPPTVVAHASALTLCSGQDLTLYGSGAQTYTWNHGVTNSVFFSPSVGTVNYTVTGTTNGCSGTPASVSVTVNQTPTITASATATTIYDGQPVTLFGAGGTTYVWDNNVINATAFSPNTTKMYTVTGTTAGCSNTASILITVLSSAGIEAVQMNDLFNAYYDKSTNQININAILENGSDISIQLYNEVGQEVYNFDALNCIGKNFFDINANKLKQGVYIVKVNTSKANFTKKVVVD